MDGVLMLLKSPDRSWRRLEQRTNPPRSTWPNSPRTGTSHPARSPHSRRTTAPKSSGAPTSQSERSTLRLSEPKRVRPRTTGRLWSREHTNPLAKSTLQLSERRLKPRPHPRACLQPLQEHPTMTRKRGRNRYRKGQRRSTPSPNDSLACQSRRLPTSLRVRVLLQVPRLPPPVDSVRSRPPLHQ
jgi:hypothetical protein